MSFDVFFQTCNISERFEERINPFTGKTIQSPVGECVTDAERQSLKTILAAAGAKDPNENGCYLPQLPDGSRAEAYFGGLADDPHFSGGMIALRGLSIELTRFMWALADSGNLVILPAMEGNSKIVTSTINARRVATRWPNATVAQSPDELHLILAKGCDGWKHYRDQVLRRTNG